MNTMQTFHTIFIVCLVLGIVFAVGAVVEFFVFHIGKVIKDITGITQKHEIKSMSHYDTGNLTWHKAHTTGMKNKMMSKSGRLNAYESEYLSPESQTLVLPGNEKMMSGPGPVGMPGMMETPGMSETSNMMGTTGVMGTMNPVSAPDMAETSYMASAPYINAPYVQNNGYHQESEAVTTILKTNAQLDKYQELETTVLDNAPADFQPESEENESAHMDIHFNVERQIILINTNECIN